MSTGRVPTTANSPLTAKGDLFGYSTTQARVAVGSDGDTLVADSAATTGLRWQGNFAAGKNKIINGDFGIWQRGTSFGPGILTYTADRWVTEQLSNATVTRQTFTPGTAPVAGYEGQYFLRFEANVASAVMGIGQKIEDVRTLAGQTVTISFWAKAAASATYTVIASQFFGSGGSVQNDAITQTISVGTSWQRFTITGSITSLSGKTIGTGSCLYIRILNLNNTTFTLDLWGVQLEAGSVATAFQTATGTLQGELAACQRYYWRNNIGANDFLLGFGVTSTISQTSFMTKQTMRVGPTSLESSNIGISRLVAASLATGGTLTLHQVGQDFVTIRYTMGSSTFVTGETQSWYGTNSGAYIALNAEL